MKEECQDQDPNSPNNQYETFSRDEDEELEPTSPLLSDRVSRVNNRTNLESLLLEPLPPASGLDYPDPMPLVQRHAANMEGDGGENGKKRLQDSDEDTDGQWDDNVDADGYGGNPLQNGKRKRCKHRTIKNYQCIHCPFKMTRFGTFFDSGTINRYLRILAMSDSEDCAASLGRDMDLIFESYNATNVIQMRDHVLTVVGRNLISQVKKRTTGQHAYRVLPTEALYRDTLQYGKTYKQYLKDFKEQKVGVMKSNALFIDSQFESGNIEKVFKSKLGQEYHLFMNVDTNTRGHQQWFYFRIRNMKKGIPYKFTIWNFTKPKSLYKDGMRLMWMSRRKAKLLGIDNDEEAWECIPRENIEEKLRYTKSPFQRSKEKKGMFDRLFAEDPKENAKNQKGGKGQAQNIDQETQTQVGYVKKFGEQSYYSLSFSLNFDYNNDTVFIAYSRPYKYSQIILDVLKNEHALMDLEPEKYPQEMKEEPARFDGGAEITIENQFMYSRKLMCLSLAGLPVPILTITATKNKGKKYSKREAVFITSRVHPGETNASFVFQGILEIITKPNDPIAQYLREQYIFKLVPCLNPDGVVRGNYRSSFAGVDLNRQWICPNEFYHPTIYHTKKELEKLYKERPILMYSDLHGHSRKRNSFMYGCNRAANGGFNSWTKVRLLPRILAKLNHVFDIISCKFKVEKGKLGTGRVVIWKEFEVTNSFTLENSFHGFDYGEVFKEFQVEDLRNLGRDLILSLHQYQKILIDIQKELNLTRGWLKPKRLLEVTGPTAQETLRIEQRKQAKKMRTEALHDEAEKSVLEPSPVKKEKKPPRGPIIKTRAGPKITLQGLIDQYVLKEKKQKEAANQSIDESVPPASAPAAVPKSGENSKTKNDIKAKKNSIVLSPKNITFKESSTSNKNASQIDERSNNGSTNFTTSQTNEKSGAILKSTGDDIMTQESINGTKKEEKIILQSIIKIQSFIRMIIQKKKYIDLQENKEEELLAIEGESNLKLPLNTQKKEDNDPPISEGITNINNEAGKLNVDVALQEQDSDGVRIVSDGGLSDQNVEQGSPTQVVQSRLQTKYVNQLTLEMIESEGVVKLQDRSKPNTAGGINRPKFKNSLKQITVNKEESKEKRGDDSISPIRDKIDEIDRDTNEGDEEDNQNNDIPEGDGRIPQNIEWRQFFTMEELTNAFDKIQAGEDPADQYEEKQSQDDNGSDSCPSEDNLELKQLYSAIYCEKNKANQAVEDLENIEEDYEKNFANFVRAVKKQYRDASKDSNVSDPQMHTEKRAEERSQVQKKQSDILLVNQGIDLSNQKDENKDSTSKPKKLKIIIPNKKKKVREVSNDSNDTNGGKLKIKTNRKEKSFIINSVKKKNDEDTKNSTIVPKRNPNDNLQKSNTLKDRRMKSQEDQQPKKPDTTSQNGSQGMVTPIKPLKIIKHISKVTGLNRSQVNKSFLPVLKASTVVAAAASNNESEKNDDQQTENENEIKISESGKSPSMMDSNTQMGMISGMGTIHPPNLESSSKNNNLGTTQYSKGFGIDIIKEESRDRSTPLGVGNEPYNQRMASTQKPGGFITDQKSYPVQNTQNQITRHPTQHQIAQQRGRVNDRYANFSTTNSQVSGNNPTQIQQILNSPTNSIGSGLASFNQPHSLYNRNYSTAYQQPVQPQPRKLTALEQMEQELLRKNQESQNKKANGMEVTPQHISEKKSSIGGGSLLQAIQCQQNNGGWQQTQHQINQNMRMPVHASIKGQGLGLNQLLQPQKHLSQSPENLQPKLKIKVPAQRQFGASMVASGISGLCVDQQQSQQQRSGPQTRQPFSPQQLKSLERPPNQYVLQKNTQAQNTSNLSNALQLKLNQQQQLSQNPQMGLLRTPRRLVHPNAMSMTTNPTQGNDNIQQRPSFLGQSQERQYQSNNMGQNYNVMSPPRQLQPAVASTIGEMQRLHFQKQYQQYKRT